MALHVVAVALLLSVPPGTTASNPSSGSPLDGTLIEQLTGAKGKLDPTEGVFKVSVPRSDLTVSVAGIALPPSMGLTSWAAFKRVEGRTMVMGDLVLEENQVNSVMSAALDNGLEVTALHNHFLWETPRVLFMHIGGMGDEQELARAVGSVFTKMRATHGSLAPPPSGTDTRHGSLDPKKLDARLGAKGDFKDGVYKLSWGRKVQMGMHEAGTAMGVNTWAAFGGSEDKAVVDGDFAVLESELQGVLKALRHAGINIVAIHQHMTGESPRMLFLHYWGTATAAELADGLKAALAVGSGG